MRVTEGLQPERNGNATAPTDLDPATWVAGLPKERQRVDGAALLDMFGEVTGAPATMWGPSIVGYGELHYVYDSGREGDMARVGFSPRSTGSVLYGVHGHPGAQALLERLGKHRTSVACLYLTKLADVDLAVLRELVEGAWRHSAPSA